MEIETLPDQQLLFRAVLAAAGASRKKNSEFLERRQLQADSKLSARDICATSTEKFIASLLVWIISTSFRALSLSGTVHVPSSS